jgi:hypothetical protein
MAEQTILIGTYNMSFSVDSGLDPRRDGAFESEAAFHMSNPEYATKPRLFWENALKNVIAFISQPNAAFIGLQEINKTDSGETGSNKITSAIKTAKPSFAVVTEKGPNAPFPALSIAWDTAKLGEEERHEIYDLNYDPDATNSAAGAPGKQNGRPMLLVLTKSGYLLITIHAPNYPTRYTGNFSTMRNEIKKNITQFMGSAVDANKTFIVGDFNDRFDALKEIELLNSETKLTYAGKAPNSCCHNWDSSCTDGRYVKLEDITNTKNNTKKRTGIGYCKTPTYQEMIEKGKLAANGIADTSKPITLAGPGKRVLLEEEGNIENYRYPSDKVFGARPAGDIQIFPGGRRGASKESDHELVMAPYIIDKSANVDMTGTAGGRRRRLSKTRRAHKRKQHKKTHRRHRK